MTLPVARSDNGAKPFYMWSSNTTNSLLPDACAWLVFPELAVCELRALLCPPPPVLLACIFYSTLHQDCRSRQSGICTERNELSPYLRTPRIYDRRWSRP